jgi:hypothetical protein
VYYLAHPVRTGPGLAENLANARAWLRWLFVNDPTRAYIAPWIAEVEAWMEAGRAEEPDLVERALTDDEAVVGHCDGLIGVGGFGWTAGMARERAVTEYHGDALIDWTDYRSPGDLPEGTTVPEHRKACVVSAL